MVSRPWAALTCRRGGRRPRRPGAGDPPSPRGQAPWARPGPPPECRAPRPGPPAAAPVEAVEERLRAGRPLLAGVFADQDADTINGIARECGLDLVQLP